MLIRIREAFAARARAGEASAGVVGEASADADGADGADADGGAELAASSAGDVAGDGEADSGVSEHPPSVSHRLVTMPVTAQRLMAISQGNPDKQAELTGRIGR